MPVTPYLAKAILDWVCNGATPTRPSAFWLAFATGSPGTATNAESNGTFTRKTVTMAAGNSPQGSVTNLNALSARANAIQTVVGWNLYDGSSGSRLMFGTLSASLGCASSADIAAIPAGGLKIVLT